MINPGSMWTLGFIGDTIMQINAPSSTCTQGIITDGFAVGLEHVLLRSELLRISEKNRRKFGLSARRRPEDCWIQTRGEADVVETRVPVWLDGV